MTMTIFPADTNRYGRARSSIRELNEYGLRRKAEIGEGNVFDFSLGNPSVPPPVEFDEAIRDILANRSISAHAYTTAAGIPSLRRKIAEDYENRFDTKVDPNLIFVTAGACPAIVATIRAIALPGEEIIAIAPFFPEYRVFAESSGCILKVVPAAEDFRIDPDALRKALSEKTKAIILNSPNNPSGAILTEEDISGISRILLAHRMKTGHTVYLISDEPYREIVFGNRRVTPVFRHYPHSIICYSYSKSLSIPGERIGYAMVCPEADSAESVYFGIVGASRVIGHVNPPSLMQRAVERCIGLTSDISEYEKLKNLLTNGLKSIGYQYVEPEGAFYLFMKALEPDAVSFSERARNHELLLVPSDDFGCTGYVRIAYCVPERTITGALPHFAALFDEYQQ